MLWGFRNCQMRNLTDTDYSPIIETMRCSYTTKYYDEGNQNSFDAEVILSECQRKEVDSK